MNKLGMDALIVGCGFCGSVIARLLAEKKGKRVLIIDRRNHIGGNMYDSIDSNGILIQQYGPHIFHTNNRKIMEFLQSYGDWNSYRLKYMVDINGVLYSMPFNFSMIDSIYEKEEGELLKNKLNTLFFNEEEVSIIDLLECEDPMIQSFAQYLFEEDYRPYTSKQWGIPPEEIDCSVLNRVPFLLSYRKDYTSDRFECLPDCGYTYFFEKLLNHPLITINLETYSSNLITITDNKLFICKEEADIPVIYTGAVDELAGYKYGVLPYRSVHFEYETILSKSYQPAAIIAHPKAIGYTRITEYRKLPLQETGNNKTTIVREYPMEWKPCDETANEPYYPVLTKESLKLYQKYHKELEDIPNLFLCGRLADFKYYNMDAVVERAIDVFQEIQF